VTSKTFLNVLSWVRSLFFTIPLIVISTIVMGTIALAGSLVKPTSAFQENYQSGCMRWWARMIVATSLSQVTAKGIEKIDPSKTYIFCCNHLSYMDPPVILATLRHQVRFLAKKSLFRIPFLGWAMRCGGHIPIDRENPRAAVRSLESAAEQVRRGMSFIIFPEGGRSLDGNLQPFLSGGFRLALKLQVPVVPIAISGTRQVLAPGSINIHIGSVQLIVGDPISTEGMTPKDRASLAATARRNIETMLAKSSES